MLLELASTSMMFAPGAMACAHSTSSDSSTSQPPVGSAEGSLLLPVWLTTLIVMDGRLNSLSNVLRSDWIFGSL